MNRRRFVQLAVALLAITAGGCSETFGEQISKHRECIGRAQIQPQKVDTCLRDTDGRRENVDVCLSSAMVPDRKIEILNQCIAETRY